MKILLSHQTFTDHHFHDRPVLRCWMPLQMLWISLKTNDFVAAVEGYYSPDIRKEHRRHQRVQIWIGIRKKTDSVIRRMKVTRNFILDDLDDAAKERRRLHRAHVTPMTRIRMAAINRVSNRTNMTIMC